MHYLRLVEIPVCEAEEGGVAEEACGAVLQHVIKSGVGQLGQQLPVLEVRPLQHHTACVWGCGGVGGWACASVRVGVCMHVCVHACVHGCVRVYEV